jgi:thiamine biosynthesis lipoprotein ApbE
MIIRVSDRLILDFSTLKVDEKRKQQERMTKILEKKISDQIKQITRKGDYVQPNIHFDKNSSVDQTMRVMMLPSDSELSKFKQFPSAKLVAISPSDSFPALKMA